MSAIKQKNTGFTLVEMVIIAPLAIILIGGLVAVIVAMTSKVMISQARNDITFTSNKALEQIESDIGLATNFLSDSGNIRAPFGSGSNFTGSGSFLSTSNQLVMDVLATDKNPLDPNRSIVYYANKPNPCGSTEAVNTPMTVNVIYFVTSDKNLWRRVVLPTDSSTGCKTPWQVNTCTTGFTGVPATQECDAKDELMATDVSSFNVDYYISPSDASPGTKDSASSAKAAEVTIGTTRNAVGEQITASYSVRASLFGQ